MSRIMAPKRPLAFPVLALMLVVAAAPTMRAAAQTVTDPSPLAAGPGRKGRGISHGLRGGAHRRRRRDDKHQREHREGERSLRRHYSAHGLRRFDGNTIWLEKKTLSICFSGRLDGTGNPPR